MLISHPNKNLYLPSKFKPEPHRRGEEQQGMLFYSFTFSRYSILFFTYSPTSIYPFPTAPCHCILGKEKKAGFKKKKRSYIFTFLMGNHSDPHGPKFTLLWDILVDSLEACTEKIRTIHPLMSYLSYFAISIVFC